MALPICEEFKLEIGVKLAMMTTYGLSQPDTHHVSVQVLCNYMFEEYRVVYFKAASSSQGRKPDNKGRQGKAIRENVTCRHVWSPWQKLHHSQIG